MIPAHGSTLTRERPGLLALTDIRGLRDLDDARSRVAAIAEIFTDRADLRGVFP
jgi:hypothetical protein